MLVQALQKLGDGLLALAYPQACHVCGEPVESWGDGVVCATCWDDEQITRLFFNWMCCVKCGILLSPQENQPVPENHPITPQRSCGQCQQMPFDMARACGAYAGALKANVLFLKSQPHVCRRLRQILCRAVAAERAFLESDVVIPVPLHRERERGRGFNQAVLLARVIAGNFNLPLDTRSLVRTLYTEKHRLGLDAIDRARSVKKAFQVSHPYRLAGASVLLIDDVFTTGSTVVAATKALLESGAQRVNVLTIAHVGG